MFPLVVSLITFYINELIGINPSKGCFKKKHISGHRPKRGRGYWPNPKSLLITNLGTLLGDGGGWGVHGIMSQIDLIFAKLSPSPNSSFGWGLSWLYFQLIQPLTNPPGRVLSRSRMTLISKVKLLVSLVRP